MSVTVHYRIGSLENGRAPFVYGLKVHYRIGSLENIMIDCSSF